MRAISKDSSTILDATTRASKSRTLIPNVAFIPEIGLVSYFCCSYEIGHKQVTALFRGRKQCIMHDFTCIQYALLMRSN